MMAVSCRTIYRFARGEPITIGLAITGGDPSGMTVYSVIKDAALGAIPPDAEPAAATFQSEFRAASGSDPAHWLFWLTAAESDGLPLGTYATDVRFSIDGVTVAITDPAWIIISESVSG